MIEWSKTAKYNSFNSDKGIAYYERYRAIMAWMEGETDFLPPPIEVNIDPYAECNLSCSFCVGQRYLRNHREEVGEMRKLPTDYLLRLVKFLKEWGVRGNCFTGDTRVKLVDGTHKTFEELTVDWDKMHQPFEVYSRDENNHIVPGIATNPRIIDYVTEILEIELDTDEVIHCTPEHEFMLKDGTYKKATDLTPLDSLMPLYIRYWGGYEYIKDTTYQGVTHKLFSAYWEGNADKLFTNELVVHHRNYTKTDNTRANLQQLTPSEHQTKHILTKERLESFAKTRDRWNNSKQGRAFIKALGKIPHGRNPLSFTEEEKHLCGEKLRNFNNTAEGRRIITERIQRINYSLDGRMNSLNQIEKINSTPEIMLRNNKSPKNIVSRRLGQINKILKKLHDKGLPLNEENYNANWENGLPKYATAIKHPNFNHKILSKKLIRLEQPIPVYCLTVEKYHNFALSSGIYVKNCWSGGGEPTLHDGLPASVIWGKQLGMDEAVVTNMVHITGAMVEALLQCRWVAMSVDAGYRDTYTTVKGRDYFNQVVGNIERLAIMRAKTNSKVDLAYKMVVLPENIHEIWTACKIAKRLGVQDFHVRPVDFERGDIEGHQRIPFDMKAIEEQFELCHSEETKDFRVFTVVHKFDSHFHNQQNFERCLMTPILLPLLTDGSCYLCVDKKMMREFRIGGAFPNPETIMTWWGSDAHRNLIKSIKPQRDCCDNRCTGQVYNTQIEQVVLKDSMCLSFP